MRRRPGLKPRWNKVDRSRSFRPSTILKKRRVQLSPDDPCPCASGKLLRECCLLPSGQLRKQPPTLRPPPPQTGHPQRGCYLMGTMDCSADLSAEHYISKSVLQAIGATVGVSGVPWLPHRMEKEIGINSLTAKILCSRHNSALSPLDSAAGTFFEKLQAIEVDLQQRSLSRKHSFVLMSGEALELWMLKLACGLFYSKNAAEDGARLIDQHKVNEEFVQEALLLGRWRDGCGLYLRPPQGFRIPDPHTISMAPLIALDGDRLVGSALALTGLEFELIFNPIGASGQDLSQAGWIHRPSELRFEIGTRVHSIALTWPAETPPNLVRIIHKLTRA
jgi:hypothetical protein